MAPPKRPWLRLYVEVVHDRKLRTRPPAERWLWVSLLAMARSSPEPGHILIAPGVRADVDVIADEANVEYPEAKEGLAYFESVGMLRRGPCDEWVLTHFAERQFESDVTAPRMAKHRQCDGDVTPNQERSNGEVTPMKRLPSVNRDPENRDRSINTPAKPFESDFVELWGVWRKKVDKAEARRNYQARRRDGVPHETLVAAALAYQVANKHLDASKTKGLAPFLYGPEGPWSEYLGHDPPDAPLEPPCEECFAPAGHHNAFCARKEPSVH